MIIVLGASSTRLENRVADILGCRTVQVERKVHADGESYVRFADDVRGEELTIIQSCSPPQDKSLVEILFMASTAKELGAERVDLVMPYFAYSREDMRFLAGEAVGANIVIKLLESVGVDSLTTFDIHNEETMKVFSIDACNLSAMPLIGEYFSRMSLVDPLVMTPDDGRPERAGTVARELGADWTYFEKKRNYVTGKVTTYEKEVSAKGRDVVVVDDIISTGTTIANCVVSLKRQGARDVHVACTHPLLVDGAPCRLFEAGSKSIVGTDSIESPYSVISLAEIIASHI